jgi:hypothetical protein
MAPWISGAAAQGESVPQQERPGERSNDPPWARPETAAPFEVRLDGDIAAPESQRIAGYRVVGPQVQHGLSQEG